MDKAWIRHGVSLCLILMDFRKIFVDEFSNVDNGSPMKLYLWKYLYESVGLGRVIHNGVNGGRKL